MAKLTEQQARLFLDENYGVVATLREDGSPHQTVVWLDWDGENVVFNTNEDRRKPHELRRNPSVSVIAIDRDTPYRWVAVSGPAELSHEGATEHIDRLALKYRGRAPYGVKPGEQRVIVRVKPERVTAYGID